MNAQLVIVDPQNDFCIADDGNGHKGSLVVPGGLEDMQRLAAMVQRVGPKLDDIHVTMDSHQNFGIERPRWWKRLGDGAPPDPFTILGIHPDGKRIVKLDPTNGMAPTEEEYVTYLPGLQTRSFAYLQTLAAGGRYPHVVWPVHCVVWEWGWGVVSELAAALSEWEFGQGSTPGRVNLVTKGNNPYTEHFSGIRAEVPDPEDPSTQVNTRLIQTLEEADIVAVGGEALSHCVANTIRDIADSFSDPKYVEKLVLLTDASSNVGGFDFLGDAFMQEMLAKGMKTSTTVEFLS